MNPPETQSDSSSSSAHENYFDPETVNSSEQFFSASLEAAAERPAFTVDSTDMGDQTSRPSGNAKEMGEWAPALSEVEGSRPFGNNDDSEQHASPVVGSELGHNSSAQEAAEDSSEPDWRDQVSAKVKHYKTLKPRKERYPSLQLQFDPPPVWKFDSPAAAEKVFAESRAAAPEPVYESEVRVPFEINTEATARVLKFPRPGMLPFNPDELAEPVIDRPRIVEAPELVPVPPALGGILIEPVREPEPERQPGLDMPLKTAQLSRRISAAALDGMVVSVALAVFGYMFLRFNSALPQIRAAAPITAVLLGMIWFGYQYAFLTFCGTTPGLRATRLKIARFDGTLASRNVRRWRVLASVLSCVSLGLGYAWCFFDEDQLSWHDRITKTHLAPK
jgi:uncharacterized RDD family membrane protein YckC